MLDRGFLIEVPDEAQSQLKIEREPAFETLKLPDLTSWMWSSIDNDDSRDLDQIEYVKKEKTGTHIEPCATLPQSCCGYRRWAFRLLR